MDTQTAERPAADAAEGGGPGADDTGARAVVSFLEGRGDRYVFGVTGSSMVSLFYELKKSPIRFVTSVHEGAAMAMADGYARVTGHACIWLYMMQGSANAMANLYNASRDNVPIMMLTMQPPGSAQTGRNIIGEGNVVQLMAPLAKFAQVLPGGASVAAWMRRADAIASESPAGPVLLSVGEDVMMGAALPPMDDRPTRRITPGAPDVTPVAEALAKAERPLLIVGSQVMKSGGADTLAAFAAAHGIPVVLGAGFHDRLSIATDHPNAMGYQSAPENAELVASADCVIAVGARLMENHAPRQITFPGARFIAHVNEDSDNLNPLTNTQWACACGSASFLAALDAMVAAPDRALLDRRATRLDERRASPGKTPPAWARALHDAADRGWVVDETITMAAAVIGAMTSRRIDRYTSNSGASLGWGTGAAIGIALATGEPVTCLLGDGTCRFGMAALWTARAYDVPVLYVVLDNGGFGSTRSFERHYVDALTTKFHGDAGYVGSDLSDLGPPIATLFKGFDIPCVSVKDGPEVRAALVEGWAALKDGPRAIVIDVGFESGAF